MPELPEVETIALDLEASVLRATVDSAKVYRRDILRERSAPAFIKSMRGVRFEHFWRRAKYLVADLSSGERLVVSPRFTGALLVHAAPFAHSAEDYTAVGFTLTDGRVLRYRDVRRLGTVTLMAPRRFAEWIAALGPEPFDLELTPERFAQSVRSSSRAIKTILMDQRRIAGIGNIYANEALWRARIRPSRRGTTITRAEAARVLAESRAVLREALAQRGTSFRDYQDPQGGRGGFLDLAKVYDREGLPCANCGTPLRMTHAIERRSTFWCTRCQR